MRSLVVYLYLLLLLVGFALQPAPASAQVSLVQLSEDTFTNTSSQHMTEVEPGAFTWGSTIVTAFQVARIFGGGGADVGFATSTDGGVHWTNGYLPGITIFQGAGTYQAASDAAVAYDALHGVWLISTLPIGSATAVAVSRSTDGIHWGNPFFVTKAGSPDKNWIVCDNTATSKFYGHCYSEWDNTNSGDLIQMSTSTDGGITWSTPVATQGRDVGIGGLPLVKPNGKVIVPILAFDGFVKAFSSVNGGQGWTAAVNVGQFINHAEAGDIRSAGLPSAAIDAKGKVFVAWPDCRFRASCAANDIVFSKSGSGTTWSAVKRVPIDPVSSTVDHFITGMAIEPSTYGTTAHIGLAYYYYPVSNCGNSCQLYAGFIQSSNGGGKWSAPVTLGGPMSLAWLPDTFSGRMVADYIAVGFGGGKAFPVFALAQAPAGSLMQEAIYTTAAGLSAAPPEMELLSAAEDRPVPDAKSDHPMRVLVDNEVPPERE
ncbi:MAG TPA: sialidase family protein [Terriglobales bacterium]|nr:sialidase family protein [Terriglobales bacterium]